MPSPEYLEAGKFKIQRVSHLVGNNMEDKVQAKLLYK